MKLEFDRTRLLANLQARMDQKNMKANELEQAIGVYSGYISRLKSEENKLPGLDVIWKMAKALGVSLDRLIEGSFEKSQENLAYMEQFVQELFAQTMDKTLDWKPVHQKALEEVLAGGNAEKYIPFINYNAGEDYVDRKEPACKDSDFRGTASANANRRVRSLDLPAEEVWLNSACFYTDFGDNQTLYIAALCGPVMPWDVDSDDYANGDDAVGRWYELVVVDDTSETDMGTLLCSTYGQGSPLVHSIRTLFQELSQHEWDYRVGDQARALIDRFMQKTESRKQLAATFAQPPVAVSEDELPF